MRIVLYLLLASLALGFTGCIEALIVTDLHADGSGTFEVSYSMSPSVAEAMKELEELDLGEDSQMPMFSDADEAEVRALCKEHGITLKSFENTDTSLKMSGTFKDLDGFNALMANAVEGEGDGGFGLFKTEDGNYLLKMVEGEAELEDSQDEADAEEAPEEEATDEADEADPAAMMKSMEIMGKLMSSISELSIVMRVTVPGDIIESNAPKTEGRTSIWEINGETMMAMDDAGEPEILFSGKGVTIAAPKLSP